ncbi:MAG: hypothetical protein JKY43_09265 [Phycisphaerales bacterium]|nr:hypothetical protein [Phycisphaerales bacterium]
MDNNGKAFNEVRALLNKMDRSIDDARTKRLGPPVGSSQASPKNSSAGSVDLDQEVGGSTPARPMTELQRKRASFGRAKPLGRNDSNSQWKSTGSDESIG